MTGAGIKKIKCFNCLSKNVYKSKENYLYSESGLNNVVLKGITVYHCEDCGELMPEIPNIDRLHDFIAFHIIEKESSLTGSEIKFLRKRLDLSGVQMAEKLGVTKVTVSRWENDEETVGVANDKLIRLLFITTKTEEILSTVIAKLGKMSTEEKYALFKDMENSQSSYQFSKDEKLFTNWEKLIGKGDLERCVGLLLLRAKEIFNKMKFEKRKDDFQHNIVISRNDLDKMDKSIQ